LKIALCNELFVNWELENVISYCADLGYDGIEIAPFTLGEWPNELPVKRRDSLRNFADNHKIDIVGLHWLLVGSPGLSLSSPDPEVRRFTEKYLIDLIDLCADLGGRILVFGSPSQRNIGVDQTLPQVWKYAKEIFSHCLPAAEKRNVTICLEPLSPQETNFINTAKQGIKFVKEMNHPHFQLHLDVKAMSYEKKSIPEIIRMASPYLRHFHVNDQDGHEPGYGMLDFQPIIEALREGDYNEYISVEVFDYTDGPEKIAARAYTYLSHLI